MATLAEEALAEEYSKHRPANTSEVSSEAAAAQAAAAGTVDLSELVDLARCVVEGKLCQSLFGVRNRQRFEGMA
eukprot:2835373-Pyramimonas_sp.AAC.2